MALPGYDEALASILDRVEVLPPEGVPLGLAYRRVLRQTIKADRDQPPFDRATMDGFAVRSGEIRSGATFDLVTDIPAGGVPDPAVDLARGVCRIATGAAVPDAYDAVIQHELAQVDSERVRFAVEGCEPWTNVHRRGSDAKAGDVLLRPGQRMGGPQLGIAAAVGCVGFDVTREPIVTVLTTGDEVLSPDATNIEPQQIRNSNALVLMGLLRSWLGCMTYRSHVPDAPDATLAAATDALQHADLVLTTGGVSAGQRDYLPGAWRQLGLDTVLHGVAIQPGRPLFVAKHRDRPALVIGLPGNPVSVLMTGILFVQPVLRRMLGLDPALPWRPRKLTRDVKPNPNRELFRAARLSDDERIDVIDWHGSGDLSHTATMRGVVRLPMQTGVVPAGTVLPYLAMDEA